MKPEYIAVRHALERYGIKASKLYKLIREGSLTAIKCGSKTLIHVPTADGWFSNLPKLPPRDQHVPEAKPKSNP